VAINNSKCVGKIFYEKGGTTKRKNGRISRNTDISKIQRPFDYFR
jgi:hypothetical protein